jgi:hypothetical protein
VGRKRQTKKETETGRLLLQQLKMKLLNTQCLLENKIEIMQHVVKVQ